MAHLRSEGKYARPHDFLTPLKKQLQRFDVSFQLLDPEHEDLTRLIVWARNFKPGAAITGITRTRVDIKEELSSLQRVV